MTTFIKKQWTRVTDHMRRNVFGMSPKHLCQVSDALFIGGQPTKTGYVTLMTWGITAIVSMRRTSPQHVPASMKLLHLPTPDHAPIALDDLQKAVRFINQQIKNNGKVYVHCHWGEGRAASVVAAYLVSEGMTVQQAIASIAQRRTFIHPNQRQVKRLHEFAQFIGRVRGS